MSIKGQVTIILDGKTLPLSVSRWGGGYPEHDGQNILNFFNNKRIDSKDINGELFPAIEDFNLKHFKNQIRQIQYREYDDPAWSKTDRDRIYDFSAEVLAYIYYASLEQPIILIPMGEDDTRNEWNYLLDLDKCILTIYHWHWGDSWTDMKSLRKIATYDLDNLPLYFSEDLGDQ